MRGGVGDSHRPRYPRCPARGRGEAPIDEQIRILALKDGRFSPEAFRFLFESLPHAVRLAGKERAQGTDRHVTGQEVLAGMRVYATQLFGPLAAPVWRSWGVQRTLDWGHIVFLLVEGGLLSRQESDQVSDFDSDLDFEESFVRQYRVELPEFPGTTEET